MRASSLAIKIQLKSDAFPYADHPVTAFQYPAQAFSLAPRTFYSTYLFTRQFPPVIALFHQCLAHS